MLCTVLYTYLVRFLCLNFFIFEPQCLCSVNEKMNEYITCILLLWLSPLVAQKKEKPICHSMWISQFNQLQGGMMYLLS